MRHNESIVLLYSGSGLMGGGLKVKKTQCMIFKIKCTFVVSVKDIV